MGQQTDVTSLVLERINAVARDWCDGSAFRDLQVLPGGTSSLTYSATLVRPSSPDAAVVVKVAPQGLAPQRNRDVLRQAQILRRMWSTSIPVPRVFVEDDGNPPFFVMDRLPGDAYEPRTDVIARPPTAQLVRARAERAARLLADLHHIELASLSISEPAVPVADELGRWSALLSTVDESICPGHRKLHDRLVAAMPAAVPARIVHGDFRLGNILFEDDEVRALIDWEIWSVGDPRIDLAWLLMYSDPPLDFQERDAPNIAAGRGMPPYTELLDIYTRASGQPVTSIEWFLACCLYKCAAILSSFVKRNRRRERPDERWVTGAQRLPAILDRAHSFLDALAAGENA